MNIDNFKLKAVALSLKLDGEMEVIGKDKRDSSFGVEGYYRIRSLYKGYPLHIRYIVFGWQDEIDTEYLEDVLKVAIEEIEHLSKKPFSTEHITFLQKTNKYLFGDEFEQLEELDGPGISKIIEKRVNQLRKRHKDNFKKIYIDYLKNYTIEYLKKEMQAK